MPETPDTLTEDRRREIFAALVEAQDRGVPVAQSSREVAATYGISPQQMAQIEREGLDNNWPPL